MATRANETTTVSSERVKLRTQRDNELVDATVKENLWAGFGAGVVVLCGAGAWCAWAGRPLNEYHLLASALTGGAVSGLLMLLRFSLDEINEYNEKIARENIIIDYRIKYEDAMAELADLRAENKRINATQRAYEFKAASAGARAVAATESVEERTLRNAERILNAWKQGLPYGRDYCGGLDMSRPEWEAAVILMSNAGIMGKGGKGGNQWIVTAQSYSAALTVVRERTGLRTRTEGTNFVAA